MAALRAKTFSSKLLTLHEIGSTLSMVQKQVINVTSCSISKRQKHYNPDFRRHRWAKVVKIELPDYDKIRKKENQTAEERMAANKKDKMPVPITYREREIVVASTGDFFEPYVPPEGDGKASVLSTAGAKQKAKGLAKSGVTFKDTRKIKKYDPDFSTDGFVQEASDIYIKAHELLNDFRNNEEEMHDYVTENAFPEMTRGLKLKTVRWRMVESLEPPKVVLVRQTKLLNDDHVFGQVTVRFHTRQTLAIYDRFGRLMYGGENLAKDCLEYVVFEKYLSDEYGRWRLHGKIVPDWMPKADPILRTMRKPDLPEQEEEKQEEGTSNKDSETGDTQKDSHSDKSKTPLLQTA